MAPDDDADIWLAPLVGALDPEGYVATPSHGGTELTLQQHGIDPADQDATLTVGFSDIGAETFHLVMLDAEYRFDASVPDARERDLALARVQARIPVGSLVVGDDGRIHLGWAVPAPSTLLLGQPELLEAIRYFDAVQQNYGDYIEKICEDDFDLSSIDALMDHFGD